MKIKLKCRKCNKEFKTQCDSFREVRALKKIYKEGKFTCWDCIGIKDGVYGIGIIS